MLHQMGDHSSANSCNWGANFAVLSDPHIIERAEKACEDIDSAAIFIEEFGLGRLGAAIALEEGERKEQGAAVLAAFIRYRAVADGVSFENLHFHSASGIHITRDSK